MRKFSVGLLLLFSLALFAQQTGRIVLNPLTGDLEYVTNIYSMGDSLVNIGYGNYPNNTNRPTKIYTIIGYGNVMGDDHNIAIGWGNTTSCLEVFSMGKNLRCDMERVIQIGMSEIISEADMPGTVALCPTKSAKGVLHVHSGFEMPNNGYVEDIGGVIIGDGRTYNNDSTALEIITHLDVENPRSVTPASAQLIATENDEWTIDPDEMTLAGSMAIGYLECDYVPKVHSAASDTSLLPIPLKIGDYYIDTSARDVYIATGTARGSWRKVN